MSDSLLLLEEPELSLNAAITACLISGRNTEQVKKGVLSNENQKLLRQAKANLKKYLSLIEQIENLSDDNFE